MDMFQVTRRSLIHQYDLSLQPTHYKLYEHISKNIALCLSDGWEQKGEKILHRFIMIREAFREKSAFLGKAFLNHVRRNTSCLSRTHSLVVFYLDILGALYSKVQ